VRDMVKVIIFEISTMAYNIQKEELAVYKYYNLLVCLDIIIIYILQRSKKQLQSLLLMNLEARPIVFEDMVRQILACGYRKRPEELLQEIGRIFIKNILLHGYLILFEKIWLIV